MATSTISASSDAGTGTTAAMLDQIRIAFEEHRRTQEARLDQLETKVSRPGAFSNAAPAPGAGEPLLLDTKTGKPMLTIRAGDDIREKFRQAGRIDDLAGDGFSGEQLTLSDFLRAVAGQRSTPMAMKALAVGTDASGGHLVPTMLLPGVLSALVAESSLLQAGATLVMPDQMQDGAKSYVMACVDTIPTAAWRNEGAAVAESDPAFRTVTATPRSLAFYFKVSRELLADAFNLETVLATVIAQAMAKEFDRAALLGTGTAPEPRGIANTAGIQTVGNGANGASLATVRYANLMSAAQAILQANGPLPNAAVMAPRTLVGFGSLADTTNQPLQKPDMLRSLRLLATSQIPVNQTVGASTDCSSLFIGDFSRTRFVVRESVSIQRGNELFAATGQVGFICHVRADFVVEYPTCMALVTGIRP